MRPRTSINQAPSGGSIYPFAEDSFLSPLVLDFYLAYSDAHCQFVAPFRIVRFAGFGNGTGLGDPAHRYDMQILDANDEIVFDTTEDPETCSCNYVTWGADRVVVEWVKGEVVARVVAYTDIAADFDDDYYPITSGAELDPRTYRQIPPHVVAFRVGVTLLAGNVQFQAGYNVALAGDVAPDLLSITSEGDLTTGLIDGGSFVNVLSLDGVPGAGLGRLAGCEETDTIIRTINRIQPDDAGNFIIEADDCFRSQLPLVVTGEGSERIAEYVADDLTTEQAKAGFKLYDDCTPCCDCHFFARTYLGLSRVWNLWQDVATAGEAAAATYREGRERWLAQRQCRLDNPLKLVALPEPSCRIFIGGVFCNMSGDCLRDVEALYTVNVLRDGVPLDPDLQVLESHMSASSTDGEEAAAPYVNGPDISFFAERLDPQHTYSTRARICYPCVAGDIIQVTLTVQGVSVTKTVAINADPPTFNCSC